LLWRHAAKGRKVGASLNREENRGGSSFGRSKEANFSAPIIATVGRICNQAIKQSSNPQSNPQSPITNHQ
jgi:hypothetical protein